ncbi:MAG: hypothetical protein ACC662_05385, partial [Planctomycetota bacterium]
MRVLDGGRLQRRPGIGPGLVLVALALVLVWPVTAWAGIGDYRCTDLGRVYLGNPRLIRKPAVVSADRVYQRIPEYRKIVDEGLTDRDVRYHFLMKKASARFAKAVRTMARAKGHDFVAEVGAVEV